MMIRLRRAGLPIDRISAVFSAEYAPNSFFLWLRRPRTQEPTTHGEPLVTAGPLERRCRGHDLAAALRGAGLDESAAGRMAQWAWLGHPVIAVDVSDEQDAAVAWHVFRHAEAADIAVAGSEALSETTASEFAPGLAPLAA